MLRRVQPYYSGLEYIMDCESLIQDLSTCVRKLGNRSVNDWVTFDLSTHYEEVVALELSGNTVNYNVVGEYEYSSAGVELPWIAARRGAVSPTLFGRDVHDLESISSSYPCAVSLDLDLFRHQVGVLYPQHLRVVQWRLNQLHARSGGRVDLALDWLYSLDRKSQV